jgi:Flp pilus assembly protein TadG
MIRTCAAFLRSTSGSTGPLFGLLAIPALLAAGVAVDFIRLSDRQTELSAVLDGAALAAATAKNASEAERASIAKSYVDKNLTKIDSTPPEVSIKLTGNSVIATISEDMPSLLMKLGGVDRMKAKARTEVMLPGSGKAEVVLVLDYSGSMGESGKYVRMAAAAKDMVAKLDAASEDGSFKVGLVPFSAMVRTTMPVQYVTQATGGAIWTGCTQDRYHPLNTGVTTPTSDAASKWGYYDKTSENSDNYDCSAYATRQLNIIPLTDDFTRVKAQLDAMRPLGNTNIALGAEFGWNLLDDAAPFSGTASYTDGVTRKYLILLTDGVQTSKQWGPGKSRNIQHGQQNLVSLCGGMRGKGITVFSIAYDVTDKQVTNLLKDCAPGKYYEPDADGKSISLVFSEIAGQISNELVRLVR